MERSPVRLSQHLAHVRRRGEADRFHHTRETSQRPASPARRSREHSPERLARASTASLNSCPGSSRSIAQMVDYTDRKGLAIAIGSDLNGNTYQVSPRFGLEACYANRVLNKGYVETQGNLPQGLSRAYGERGLAHVGFLPELVADLRALGTPGTTRIESSAENFIQMWERAYDVNVADLTNETARREDGDCVDGWYCSTGLTGLEPNKCKAKLEDGQRCMAQRQCRSGACDASLLHTRVGRYRRQMPGQCAMPHGRCSFGR